MNGRRFVLLLIVALAAISAALYFTGQRDASQGTQGVPLLPSLARDLDSVSTVMLRKGGATPGLTLHKRGSEWTLAERADYPADLTKLRKLLMSLRDAHIVEEKTADPKRFADIGVEDPALPGAAGTEITVVAAAAKSSLIVGKPAGEGSFVRRAGENQSYSVEPGIMVETEPRYWIDSHLIDVPVALMQNIEVKPATGARYSLRRLNPADDTFSLEGVPAGRKALDGHALAPSPSTFASLTAEDVSPAGDVDFSSAAQLILTLTDGNIITLTGAVAGTKHWLQVMSSKDAALTAKLRGRAFEIAGYRYDALFKPVDQWLVPLEPPASKAPGATPAAKKPVPAPPAP